MIKAILLDLDDTLLDQKTASEAGFAVFHSLRCAGLPFEEARRRWDRGIEIHFPRFVRGEIGYQDQRRERIREVFAMPGMDDAAADAHFAAYLAAYEANYALFPDVLPFLDAVRGYPLGIVSNGETRQQKDKLARTGIAGRFGTVLISEEAGLRKPDPRIFRSAARNLGVEPSRCVFIGDNPEADYAGSRDAGMLPVLIDRAGKPAVPGITRVTSLAESLSLIGI